MYLSEVRVRNFRNLKDFSIGLSRGLNVVLGENNIGKTNLLDAIRAALGPAAAFSDSLRLTKDDRHRTAEGIVLSSTIQIDLWFKDLSEDEAAELIEALNVNAGGIDKTTASIHYEWTWSEADQRWHHRRWGGDRPNADAHLPDEVLQTIPPTFLSALRDALSALSPGRQSRLGRLLKTSHEGSDQGDLEAIIREANTKLEGQRLIKDVEGRIERSLQGSSGTYTANARPAVRASEPDFDRIVNSLRLVLLEMGGKDTKIPIVSELGSNGLGMNNLIFIATVLAELEAAKDASLPLLLVEEPEAHLHPQLQVLLADFLGRGNHTEGDRGRVQTIVTTHSPTIAAHVQPTELRVLHREESRGTRCTSIASCGLDQAEARKLRRMLDVTRASMLFARGIILVEGISEALLLPVLAHRLEKPINLADYGISVVPISGVSFGTFAKILGHQAISTPVSIITDGDPDVDPPGSDAKSSRPKEDSGRFIICDRVENLLTAFKDHRTVQIFHSDVTLEYDLARTSDANAEEIFSAWASCYTRTPRTLTAAELAAAATAEDKALLLWRALCLGRAVHGKAEVAQALAERLEAQTEDGKPLVPMFKVPKYMEDAITHVIPSVDGVA